MKRAIQKFGGKVRKFNRDQRGMEAVQVILIIAVAAIIGVALWKSIAKPTVESAATSVGNVINISPETNADIQNNGATGK